MGNSLTNVRQVFNSTIVYDLPFFKGAHGWKRRVLLVGWKLDEIATIQNGLSLDLALSVANQGLTTRPNAVGPLSYPKQFGRWFSTSAFAKPAAGFYGNAGTGTILGPGMIVFDTRLYKDFAITERHVFELRGEIFNTFNHTNFFDSEHDIQIVVRLRVCDRGPRFTDYRDRATLPVLNLVHTVCEPRDRPT